MTPLRHLLPALPVLLLVSASAEAPPPSVLFFTNGNRLTGVPGAINEEGNLVVEHAENLSRPAAFHIPSLLDIHLPDTDHRPPESNHQAVLKLTNGDTVRGQLSALDDEHVTLDSWYGGTLRIRRCMATGLEVLRSEKSIYRGPDSLENWTAYGEKDAWSFRDGRFVASGDGGIAREFDLPSKVHFSFDIAWRTNLSLRIILFADEGENDTPENCYHLTFQRRTVYFRKNWFVQNRGANPNLGHATNISQLAQNEKIRIDLYIDREAGSFAFFVDGKQSEIWVDPEPAQGALGNWLHLISEDYPLRISHIEAGTWSGDLPDDPAAEPEDPPLEEEGQSIKLHNGDELTGEVEGIKDGVLTLSTKHVDTILVPVERMRTIDLTVAEPEEPRRKKGDIRAWLRDGGFITFQLKAFTDGKLTGYSQTFGTAEFALDAFSRLEFNIYDEALDPLREQDDW